ncbi:MAG: hypothetical protein GX313_02250 [Spirochaetales bacterium]|jgi:hypothetical protein|nr:hypothetical protein [Spirochaetales bacterium]
MKKRLTLVLIVSAFFIFIGCGIPTIFTIDSSIRVLSKTDAKITAKYVVDQSTLDDLGKIDPMNGPKIFLGYAITGSSTTFEGYSASRLQTAFEAKAGKAPYGRHIRANAYEADEGIFSIKDAHDENLLYVIYPFSDTSGGVYTSPNYHVMYTDPTAISLDDHIETDFAVEYDKANGTFSVTPANPSYKHQTNNKLARIQQKPFSSIQPEDEDVVAGGLYVHLFAAINISQGDFNNIYWTNLKYLGSMEI